MEIAITEKKTSLILVFEVINSKHDNQKKQNTSYDVTICIMMSSTKGSDVMTGSDANIIITGLM